MMAAVFTAAALMRAAVMVEIAPHSYLNAELLALASGRGRTT